eukprot:Seg2253.6 transcript_id=Seg2253.6/GoldUCD/mRNA.D3Y31 product="Adhesion G protein-coupled receptor L2" protein_id=Seg2253.6/GoldUCD/D3Y31
MLMLLFCFVSIFNFSYAANVTTLPFNTTTTKPPTTLSTLALQQIWCRANYASWRMPDVTGCLTTFKTDCHTKILNATNGYLLCYKLLGGSPTSVAVPKMLLPGSMFDLGLQIAKHYDGWRATTTDEEKYRLWRSIYSNMIFEAGVAYKLSDRVWPDYKTQTLFAKPKWNGRNDTIKLPYATIPSGIFKYSFHLYDNTHGEFVARDDVRLKKSWRAGHLVSSGAFIDYNAEQGLVYSSKYVINTAVISLSLEPIPKAPVASDIIITLWHKKKKYFQPWCVYWQYVKTSDTKSRHHNGYWTNYGMKVVKTNDTTTVCSSSYIYMSSFAVIMEPYYDQPPEPTDPFTLATTLLTIASILAMIVFVFAMVSLGCVKTKYSRMYVYIAIGCILSQIAFLYALTKKNDWSMCTTMSTVMQLCHTSVMSWMMLESVHQLSRIRYFFNEEKSNIEAFYNVIGWGFPVAVIISLFGYPFEKFTKIRYCWVYVKGMDMWFFAGPLAALFLISVILRLITFYEIRKHPERLKRDINYQRAWRSLVASCFFLPLIAGLWYIATLGVTKEDSEAGMYLMCLPVLNAIVGVMIFIFYFYKNDEVYDALVEQRKIKEKKRLLRYEHLKGMRMKVNYRAGNNEDYLE